MRKDAIIACVILVLCGCSSDKGFGTTEEVTADDYGSAWPLTVDSAKLTCSEVGSLSITVDGQTFALDPEPYPAAIHPNLGRALIPAPSSPNGYKDLAPLLEDAGALCE